MALKSIFSVFNESVNDYKKSSFVDLVLKTFPPIQTLTVKLLLNFNSIAEVILLVVLKIFGKATYIDVIPNLKNSPAMHAWYIFLKKILDIKAENPSPTFIKMKKRALKILYRFVQKHTNPKYDEQYSKLFCEKYAQHFLDSVLLALMTMSDNKEIYEPSMLVLPYFYKNFPNCRQLLNQHKEKILTITIRKCMITE